MNEPLNSFQRTQIREEINLVKNEIRKVFIGQEELIEGSLAALFSCGHLLIEGVPGLGKTLLARSLGQTLGCNFSRIQFTPDLMPSDITGSHIYNLKEQKFVFNPGPIFTHLLLADEINRAPAKTHSALLEIMQENQVTLDGKCYKIEPPFIVMATQNPVESEGTYALPEAELDRFLLKLLIQYPSEQEEADILKLQTASHTGIMHRSLESVLSKERVLEIIKLASQITISHAVIDYINKLVRITRERNEIYLGCSPRAGIALIQTSRIIALMDGRAYVVPDDIKRMAPAVFRHRIILTPEAEVEGISADHVIEDILNHVEVPKESA